MTIEEFRAQFPILRTRAFLFSGALTPAALPCVHAFDDWGKTWTTDPLFTYNRYHQELEGLRIATARLLGADPSEIAITENTSAASNLAVRMLASSPRASVVVDDTTYPSSLYPWLTSTDKQLRYVQTDGNLEPAGAFAEAVDEDVVAVTITHVGDLTGRRHQLRPISEVAHAAGATFVVDTAQSAGIVPLDVRHEGIDIATGTFMKWLLGPPGLGFLYISRELIDQLPLLDVGYEGVRVPWGAWPQLTLPEQAEGARRYQLGVPSLPSLAAARAGVELVLEVGVEAIQHQSVRLVELTLAALHDRDLVIATPDDPSARGSVIAYDTPDDKAVEVFLRRRGVDIGALGFGRIRIDPHGFNNDDDIARLVEGLDVFAANRGGTT